MAQRRSGDIENSGSASTEALPATEGLAESRTSLSEWQTDPELKFYGRAMSSANSKRLAGQRLALEIYALVVVVLAAGIVVATYAYSFNRWHDGNGSPLKDEPSVNLGSKLSATDQLGDLAFRRYVAFVVASTCVITGLGAEIVIGKAILSALSTKTGTTLWHFTQLLFSLFLMIAILAAGNHDVIALPFLVAGLWKFGFPETIGCFLEARTIGFADAAPTERVRAACAFLDGLGTLLHHTAGVLFVVVVLVGLAPLNRPMIAASIPLVIQHWFVLVRYRNTLLYGLIMAGCEVFWEFELIASLPQFTNKNGIDRVVRPIAYLMLEAHWIYWVAGITRFLLPEPSTTLGDARPALGRQRTIKNWLGLFGRRSKSDQALASPRSPRSPKTIPRP